MQPTDKKTPSKLKAAPEKGVAQKGTQSGFGYQKVAPDERTNMVREVFASVAPRYDVMNDVMSFGVHRLWKRDFVQDVAPGSGDVILDLAGGTGDIAFLMVKIKGVRITVCDINPAMLNVGKSRAMDRGLHGAINWVEGNAEELPFPDASFDKVTIAFGLRNVTHLSKALKDIRRVLKPGGRFYCLEFSQMAVPTLQKMYDVYSFTVLPWLGKKIAGDRHSYQYLAESIRAFPDQEALLALMNEAGFAATRYRNLSFGIAAIHSGIRP